MLEETTTIPWNGENVKHNYVHNFANESSSFTGVEEHAGRQEMLPRPNCIKAHILNLGIWLTDPSSTSSRDVKPTLGGRNPT
ncbi:hypothetical protein QYF36_011818 [Acer negundo]|nr:hypothetical protein QYF36_011818 [Acer negundo]